MEGIILLFYYLCVWWIGSVIYSLYCWSLIFIINAVIYCHVALLLGPDFVILFLSCATCVGMTINYNYYYYEDMALFRTCHLYGNKPWAYVIRNKYEEKYKLPWKFLTGAWAHFLFNTSCWSLLSSASTLSRSCLQSKSCSLFSSLLGHSRQMFERFKVSTLIHVQRSD